MTNLNIILKDNINFKNLNLRFSKQLPIKFEKIFHLIKNDINKSNKTINVLDGKFKFNFKIKDLKKFKKFKTIALIGMGGSILGTQAIYSFFQTKIKKKIYFFDDINEDKILNFKRKENIKKVLFIIISKSGNTIETLSNVFSLKILKRNSKNIIIITEKNNNKLFLLSKKLNLFYVEHKDYIGGRYSVLSEVGIIPAYLMGLNIFKLRSKTFDYFKSKNKALLKNTTVKIANIMNSRKYNNMIFLNYAPEFEKFLYWYQQLMAESLGKKNRGFLPVISNAPKDHHSLLQLYLDGPKDKIFNIFSLQKKSKEKIILSKNIGINSFLNKKELSKVKNAQKDALIKSFKKRNIPYREFKINKINEEVLGKLFSFFMIETIIVGKLLRINPFDQPAVEQVKDYTKKLLR